MDKIFHIKVTYSIKRYKKNMQTDSTKMRLSSFGNN